MSTEPKHTPANHPPYKACSSISIFWDAYTIAGKACASWVIASTDIKLIIGFLSYAYNTSTVFAIVFMPEYAEISVGKLLSVNSGSWITTLGKT